MNFHSRWAHVCLHRRPDPNRYHGMTAKLTTEIVRHNHGCPTVKAELLDLISRQIDRRMTEYHQVIGVLAAIAPLLGLLGTVTGMMTTFNVMALFGTGNARAMANGISEALITTQTGLLIAIPGLYLKGWLDRQARTLQQQMSAALYFFRRQSAVHQRMRKLKKVR